MRLDKMLFHHARMGKKSAREVIESGFVSVDDEVIKITAHPVSEFCKIQLHGDVIYEKQARYYILHKPIGYLSATVDDEQSTVMDLLDVRDKGDLHLAGRLDKNTSYLRR